MFMQVDQCKPWGGGRLWEMSRRDRDNADWLGEVPKMTPIDVRCRAAAGLFGSNIQWPAVCQFQTGIIDRTPEV